MRSTIKYALASVVWFLSLGCQPTPNTFTPPPFQPDLVVDSGELEINLDRWFLPIKNSNDSYPSVCSLHLFDGSLIGSGILIRPDVVLTAGHCIDEDNIYSITIGEEEIMVKDMVIHPYYSNSFGRVRNDVGLIFFFTHFAGVIMMIAVLLLIIVYMQKLDRFSNTSLLILLASKMSLFVPLFPVMLSMNILRSNDKFLRWENKTASSPYSFLIGLPVKPVVSNKY